MSRNHELGVVDNDRMALAALSTYLRVSAHEWNIKWYVDSGQTAIRRCLDRFSKPDVLLLDVSMPSMDGIAVAHNIRVRDKDIVIIAMTAFPLEQYATEMALAGAQAIVGKNDPDSIIRAIDRFSEFTEDDLCYADVQFDTPVDAFNRLSRNPLSGIKELSGRENEIIDLCRQGWTSKRIAEYMKVSPSTVETHLRRACGKVGAHNRVELISIWLEHKSMK